MYNGVYIMKQKTLQTDVFRLFEAFFLFLIRRNPYGNYSFSYPNMGRGRALTNLESFEKKRVFVVTDPFMVESGFVDHLTKHLSHNKYLIFSDIVPDPPIDKIVSGIKQLVDFKRRYDCRFRRRFGD